MPRSGVWPADADEPPPTAGTLFHHEPPSTISLRAGDTDPGVIAARASAGNGRAAATAAEPPAWRAGRRGSRRSRGARLLGCRCRRRGDAGRPARSGRSSSMPGGRRSWPDRSTRPCFEWVSRFGSRRPSRRRSSRRPTASRDRRSMSSGATPIGRSGSRRKQSVRTPPQRGPGRVTVGTRSDATPASAAIPGERTDAGGHRRLAATTRRLRRRLSRRRIRYNPASVPPTHPRWTCQKSNGPSC